MKDELSWVLHEAQRQLECLSVVLYQSDFNHWPSLDPTARKVLEYHHGSREYVVELWVNNVRRDRFVTPALYQAVQVFTSTDTHLGLAKPDP